MRRAAALLAVAVVAAIGLLSLGAAPQRASAATCDNADATIDQATEKELRKALVCLINDKRHKRDRHQLDQNDKLQEAAKRHNNTMLADDCWKHKCPGEPGLEKRIRKTGYLDGSREWHFAENFGCALTPRGMLDAWTDEDFTRRNMLNPVFRDIGAAAAKDLVPSSPCAGERVTYTVVFASR
jgi:uncharacterized protein YkwD